MTNIASLLIFIAMVLHSTQSQQSSNFISSIINGSLNDSWRLDLKLFIIDFRGVILYTYDSIGNQFGIIVTQDIPSRERIIRIKFNSFNKMVSAKELCGCITCDSSKVHLTLISEKLIITLTCNGRSSTSLVFMTKHKQNKDKASDVYTTPKSIRKTSNKTLIMIGNVNINPYKEQLIGCLYSFKYNNMHLRFTGNNKKVSPSCPCNNNYNCNGGLCQDIDLHNYSCDCSRAQLNGLYCNRSLRMYDRGGNNSYENENKVNQIYMKMTWKQRFYKVYCLMEILSERNWITIFTDKNNVFINSTFIRNVIKINRINVMKVYLSNDTLMVKVKNVEIKQLFKLKANIRFNIGFSKYNSQCETFIGEYDVYNNPLELGRIYPKHNSKEYPSNKTLALPSTRNLTAIDIYLNTSKNTQGSAASSLKNPLKEMRIIVTIAGTLFCLVILTAIVLLYVRARKRLKTRFLNTSRQDPGKSDDLNIETGLYGEVDDEFSYYTIEEMNVYATIDT